MSDERIPHQPSSLRYFLGGLGLVLLLGIIAGGAYLLGTSLSNEPLPMAAPVTATTVVDQPTETDTPSPAETSTPTPIPISELGTSNLYVEYILDASADMNGVLADGSPKLDAARDLLAQHLRTFRPETNVGLRTYGHRIPADQTARSCEDIELIAAVEKGQVETIATWLGGAQAQGLSPLAESLRRAADDFSTEPDRINTIVLITAGEDNCGEDPCAVVEELIEQGIQFTLHIVGLDVSEASQDQLTCVADAGQGDAHFVSTQQELRETLEQIQSRVTQAEVVTPPLGEGDPWIAYVGEDEHIWLVRPDGAEAHRLSDRPGARPAWSPSGDLLAFESEEEGSTVSIYVMAPDDTQARRVVENGRSPAWSADDKTIAFVRHHRGEGESAWSVHTVRVEDGQETEVIGADQEFLAEEPWLGAAWHAMDMEEGNTAGPAGDLQWVSGGGEMLLRHVYVGAWSGEWQAGAIQVDTARVEMLPVGYYPSLSPNGGQVAYCGEGGLFVMNLSGQNPQQLSHTEDCRQPVWAPDGSFLLFSNGNAVWRVNVDGGDEYLVVQPEAVGCAHYSFSHDGKAFLFSQVAGDDDAAEVGIWRAMVDGSELQELAVGGQPAWQPARDWAGTDHVVVRQTPTLTPTPTPSPTLTPTPTPTDTPTLTPTPTATSKPKPKPPAPPANQKTRSKDGMVMILIPAGEFAMGAPNGDGQANSDERPLHTVYLDTFWIDRTEVTNAQYQKCVAAGSCPGSAFATTARFNGAQQPAVGVSWQNARAYCSWVGARLPTEAEWEKAARGTDSRKFPWGNKAASCGQSNFWVDPNGCVGSTVSVGQYSTGASPYGVLDMAGNVWEWVSDLYGERYYSNSLRGNPQGPSSGNQRVTRGGSWDDPAPGIRTSNRNAEDPGSRYRDLGFRCVALSVP